MSLTGTRPTVGLIYVGLAKAIGGTPTAIALLYKTGGRESHPANGDHTALAEVLGQYPPISGFSYQPA